MSLTIERKGRYQMECSQCNEPVQPSWEFCQSCGNALSNGQGTAASHDGTASTSGFSAVLVETAPADLGPVATTLPAATAEEAVAVPPTVWPAGTEQATSSSGESARVTVRPLPAPLYLPNSPVRLSYEERILRQYAAVRLRKRKSGEGILYVTDSRVVFYARAKGRGTQRASSLMQQTKISEISGVSAYVFRRYSILWVIAAILSGIVGLVGLKEYLPVGLLFIVICVVCIIAIIGGAAHRGGTGVMIHSSSENGSAIDFGRWGQYRGIIGQLTHLFSGVISSGFGVYTVWDVVNGMPNENSDQIINELGALILDLQTRGDLVFQHYGAGIEAAREPQLPYGQS
jgi:hypothetical protein